MEKDLIREMCRKLGLAEGKLSDEYLFTISCVNLYYFDGQIGLKEIQDGFVDGANDGGIDFILTQDNTLYLIQGKTSEALTIEDIENLFNKIHNTVSNFSVGHYSQYSKLLCTNYLNLYDSFIDTPNITLVLFTNSVFDDKKIKSLLQKLSENHLRDYELLIYDRSDISLKEKLSDTEKEYVSEDRVTIDNANNCLKYGENGVVVNIKASSLKKLYNKHSGQGLFNYNLREHISQKNVDSGIENTIKKEKANFWYYNNGVTFACEDFHVDGNVVKLYNFSIINGAQTTTKIGKSNTITNTNDFDLVCKIIKTTGTEKLKDNFKFISNISEYSNSQKPIKNIDLKANKNEQKLLQIEAAQHNHPLSILIKRGVKPDNYKKVEKWQKISNEYLGQLILSFIFQRPGTARSGKASIFSTDAIYNMIYLRKHDYDTLYDLVKLAYFYDEFRVGYIKETEKNEYVAIAQNGKFVILALIAYIIKKEKSIIDSPYSDNLNKDNLHGTLIRNYEGDIEKEITHLFKYLIKVLNDIYNEKFNELKLTSYSNFFKTDKTYKDHILTSFESRIYQDEFELDRIKKALSNFDI